ncbi:MAG: hypothetical protein P857_977 [Candidatus Xenolissoclinum pacificiensis L6]|uniref:Uncharacterized protein n=1 Tax=Candidatus Xenolissoclinum pacificiensis L6 TaxID=1401685 RepID=W2V131_9RICK|nr:MAG: hypothetical protein P857_977 [Candidatus Xenolissoclinum pacificiensis L6]
MKSIIIKDKSRDHNKIKKAEKSLKDNLRRRKLSRKKDIVNARTT